MKRNQEEETVGALPSYVVQREQRASHKENISRSQCRAVASSANRIGTCSPVHLELHWFSDNRRPTYLFCVAILKVSRGMNKDDHNRSAYCIIIVDALQRGTNKSTR